MKAASNGYSKTTSYLPGERDGSEMLRLTLKDRDAGAAVLGRAFSEYELLQYYFQDTRERRAVASTVGFVALSVCLKYGEAYASSEKLEGVAAWLPPGHAPFGVWQILRSVTPSVLFRFGRQGGSRMGAYGRYVDALHRRLVPYPHWYLEIIGVDPAYHGQGFSSRLVRPVLERIDRERMPCFLETSSSKNVAIYRRFGFEVISEHRVSGTEVTSYAMLREVQTM